MCNSSDVARSEIIKNSYDRKQDQEEKNQQANPKTANNVVYIRKNNAILDMSKETNTFTATGILRKRDRNDIFSTPSQISF